MYSESVMEFTIISVIGTMIIGMFIGRKLLKVDRDTAYLISSGTAICGGSAIAAVGPVLKAKDSEMSVALATIFVLNAIALFIFPVLGHTYVLDGVPQFGQAVSGLARKGLIITMFFIGASLSMDVLKQVGMKPLVQGVALWAVISISSLAYILLF